MSLLAPLFLLGALAVALPVVFHLIRRTTRQRTIFSSLMFLTPSPPRLTRRSRLEHLLLLALRCLVLCLLAAAFARPFIKKAVSDEPSAAAPARLLVLLDTSASMRRPNLWPDALGQVREALRTLRPADQMALFTFDREARSLVTFEQWQAAPAASRTALVTARLKEISPGWSSTHLGRALITAAEALADPGGKSAPGPRRILLISDVQDGAHVDRLQGYEWPKGVQLSVSTRKPRHAGNAGLQLVTDAEAAGAAGVVRVRVSNTADARQEQFRVGWAQADGRGFAGPSVEVYVPRGQSRIAAVPAPPVGLGLDRIILHGDEEDFDNTIFVSPPETARLKVLYFGDESAQDARRPLYFLQRAFQETRFQAVQVVSWAAGAPLPIEEARAAAFFVVTDGLTEDRSRVLRDQVTSGKTLLCALPNTAAASTLGRLLDVGGLDVREARPNGYAMLAEIDFRHPIFAPFADPRFSDFTRIHFWKYRRLEPGAIPGTGVLAKFDSGDPALLEVRLGKGRVLVLTSGWQPEDSQLALSTKFVPLLYSMLDYSGSAPPQPVQVCVGDVVPLSFVPGAEQSTVTIRGPQSTPWTLAPGQTNFSQANAPGIYTVTAGGATKRFAVNLDAAESRTAPLPMDELERLGAPLAPPPTSPAREAARRLRLENTELEARQKLWRWVIVGALAVLLTETWLAGRTARQSLAAEEATS